MEHPLIIQPARAKFLKIQIMRDTKVIWKNYDNNPNEDKQGFFAYSFKQEGKRVIIPAHANEGMVNNLLGKETKILSYTVPEFQSKDKITVALYVQFAKDDCAKVVDLSGRDLTQPQLMKEIDMVVK